MSGFIPMVSTTPPPIDDADFGDFMDSTQNDDDDFGDFSTSKDYDDVSCPSPPPDDTNSFGQGGDEDDSGDKMHSLGANTYSSLEDFPNSKEVENIINTSSLKKSGLNSVTAVVNGELSHEDGVANENDEDDWFAACDDSNENQIDSSSEEQKNEESSSKDPEQLDADSPNNASPTYNDIHGQTEDQNSPASSNSVHDDPSNSGTENDDSYKFPPVTNEISQLSVPSDYQSANDINEGSLRFSQSLSNESDKEPSDYHSISLKNVDSNEDFSNQSGTISKSDSFDDFADFNENVPEISQAPQDVMHHSDLSSPVATPEKIDEEFTDPNATLSRSDSFDDFADFPLENQSESQVMKEESPTDDINEFSSNMHDGSGDDFANFDSFTSPPIDSEFSATTLKSEEQEGGDDFGAFDNYTDNVNSPDIATSKPDNMSSEFNDFSTNTGQDDDFGDFNTTSASDWSSFSNTVTKKLTLLEKVDNFVAKFKIQKSSFENGQSILHLDEHLHSHSMTKDVESPTASVESMGIIWSGELWEHLEDIDNTIALSFVWNGSRHNKYLLDALGMHTQNILFSGTKQAYYVPTYYAAALGMVDPSKGIMKPMSAAEKITAMSPTDKNSPPMEDFPKEESHSEWKTIADEQSSGQDMPVANSWLHTDQLTNNQDGSVINTANKSESVMASTMDLDYFDNLPGATENVKPSVGADLIDPELLELTSAPTTEPPPPPKDSGSATLSKILASIKGESNNIATGISTISSAANQDHSKWEEEESKLSNEARSVLQKLPDLSYMRSKVLIFPMNMSRVKIGEE